MNTLNVINTYAAYINDYDLRMNSSSGGIFTEIAEHILGKGGIVYGVSMSSDCRQAFFKRIDDIKDLGYLRGSKYLQALVGDTYKAVKKDLEQGLLVLFTGVGCQINGLKCFLGKEFDNLICVDVVCHGAPSQKLWGIYVDALEKKYSGQLISVNFRCKNEGWKNFGVEENTSCKTIFTPKGRNPYMLMFLDNYCLRPSCYECTAKQYKLSDISLADFWGIEKIQPEMNDGNGVSLVITRTTRGDKLLSELLPKMKVAKVAYEDAVKENIAEFRSVTRPTGRDTFFTDLDKLTFEKVKKKYAITARIPLKHRLKNLVNTLTHSRAEGGLAFRNYGLQMVLKEQKGYAMISNKA